MDVTGTKKEVCQKLESDLKKAYADINKANKAYADTEVAIIKVSKDSKSRTEAMSKVYADIAKYKCLKDTPSCIKALKAMSKGFADLSKYYANQIIKSKTEISIVPGKKPL